MDADGIWIWEEYVRNAHNAVYNSIIHYITSSPQVSYCHVFRQHMVLNFRTEIMAILYLVNNMYDTSRYLSGTDEYTWHKLPLLASKKYGPYSWLKVVVSKLLNRKFWGTTTGEQHYTTSGSGNFLASEIHLFVPQKKGGGTSTKTLRTQGDIWLHRWQTPSCCVNLCVNLMTQNLLWLWIMWIHLRNVQVHESMPRSHMSHDVTRVAATQRSIGMFCLGTDAEERLTSAVLAPGYLLMTCP